MESKEMLFELCSNFGVSGNEYGLAPILEKYFKEYTDEFKIGKLGDFAAVKKGTSNGEFKVMLAAHADEIGLMVKDINDRGFVYFTSVGGVDAKTLPSQEVIIHGKKEVFGVIGAKPPHVLTAEDMKKAIKMEDMMIDTGMTKEELLQYVSIGDFITVKRSCTNLLGEFVTGKALDDRAGICAMLECAKELKRINHAPDVYFVATTMEELGHLGVRTMAYDINPDVGIAIDVTVGDKYANPDVALACGEGVRICKGPNIHPELVEKLIKTAKEYNVEYGIGVVPGRTGTDAWDIQVAREGIPTLLLSIPLRYMHTSTEVISYSDVVKVGRLLALFIASLKDWRDIYA